MRLRPNEVHDTPSLRRVRVLVPNPRIELAGRDSLERGTEAGRRNHHLYQDKASIVT